MERGFTTVSCSVLACASCAALRFTVSEVALTNVVGAGVPLSCTVEFDSNPVPVRVNIPAAPTATTFGFTDTSTGVGLST